MNLLKKALMPLLLMAAIAVQGCKSDSTGPDNNGTPVTNTKPAAGSTYTYDRVSTQNGSQVNSTTNTYTVLPLDVEFAGKSGVYLFRASIGDTANKYIYYESNGNISVPSPSFDLGTGSTEIKWMTLPITGSGGSTGLVLFNGDVDLGFLTANIKITTSASAAGEQNFTVGGKTYAAKKIKTTTNATVDIGIGPVSESSDDFHYWIPEIGFYAKSEEATMDPTSEDDPVIHTETLTQFDLQ